VDNIKKDFGERELGGLDRIGLAQDKHKWRALVNAVTKIPFPKSAGNLSTGCTTGILSSSARLHGVRDREKRLTNNLREAESFFRSRQLLIY
jgi:hypothetical protein